MLTTIAVLALGATLGASLRYYVTLWAAELLGLAFPYGTFLVNICGCLLLGGFIELSTHWTMSPQLRLLIATGFCGSLTTFSTFGYETVLLLSNDTYGLAALNVIVSVLVGLLAVYLGVLLVRWLVVA
jgi:CrcB protein